MDKMSFTSLTSARPKNVGTPKTVLEKFEKLKLKSIGSTKHKKSNLELLVETFDLRIEL